MSYVINKKRVLAIASDKMACGKYRITQPQIDLALRCNNGLSKLEFKLLEPNHDQTMSMNVIDSFDAVVLQRIITPSLLKMAYQIKKQGKILIHEIDDDLYNINTVNPFHRAMKNTKYKEIYGEALKLSDYIFTTTPEIKESFVNGLNIKSDKVFVFPNAIDPNHPKLQPDQTRRGELPSDKVVILYGGGSSHFEDVRVLQVMESILRKYKNAVFAFCSHIQLFNDNFSQLVKMFPQRVIFIPPITDNFDNFPNLMSMGDIGTAPLTINKFNNCKSWLKCLEYGIWGLPTVCSPISDYKRFNELSQASVIVEENSSKQWEQELSKLIEDNEGRKEMGLKAREYILNNLTLKQINKKRLEFYNMIFK